MLASHAENLREHWYDFALCYHRMNCHLFIHEVTIDLVWLEESPILYVVDTDTDSKARLLYEKTSTDIWNAFDECWAALYVGYSNIIQFDQEVGFSTSSIRELANAHGINLRFLGAQSHNSLGSGETYHALLRRVLNFKARTGNNIEIFYERTERYYKVKRIGTFFNGLQIATYLSHGK